MYPQNIPNASSSSRYKILEFIKKHRVLAGLMLSFIIIIIFGIILFFLTQLKPEEQQQIPEVAPYPSFEHQYLIDSSIGSVLSNDALYDIGNIIISPTEISTAPALNTSDPENLYIVDLQEESYRLLNDQLGHIYQMNAKISDSRTYEILICLDPNYGQEYMVIVLDRTDTNSATDFALIYTNDTGKYATALNQWIESLHLNDPIVTISSLPTP